MKHITNNEALEIFKKYDPNLYEYYFNNAHLMSYNARNYAEYLKKQNESEGQRMKHKSEEMRKAYTTGGWRERYAMENGNRATVYINGHKCIKFTYDTKREYQDANGATFDTVRGVWIA